MLLLEWQDLAYSIADHIPQIHVTLRVSDALASGMQKACRRRHSRVLSGDATRDFDGPLVLATTSKLALLFFLVFLIETFNT